MSGERQGIGLANFAGGLRRRWLRPRLLGAVLLVAVTVDIACHGSGGLSGRADADGSVAVQGDVSLGDFEVSAQSEDTDGSDMFVAVDVGTRDVRPWPDEITICEWDERGNAWVEGQEGVGSSAYAAVRWIARRGDSIRVALYWWNAEIGGGAVSGGISAVESRTLPPGIYYFDVRPGRHVARFVGGTVVPGQFWWRSAMSTAFHTIPAFVGWETDDRTCKMDTGPIQNTACFAVGTRYGGPSVVEVQSPEYLCVYCGVVGYARPSEADPNLRAIVGMACGTGAETEQVFGREIVAPFDVGQLGVGEIARSGFLCGAIGAGFVDIAGSYLHLRVSGDQLERLVGTPQWEVHAVVSGGQASTSERVQATDFWMGQYLEIEGRTVIWIARGGELLWIEVPGGEVGIYRTDIIGSDVPYSFDIARPWIFMNSCLMDLRAPVSWGCQSDLPGGSAEVIIDRFDSPGGWIEGSFSATLVDRCPYECHVARTGVGIACGDGGGGFPSVVADGRFKVRRPGPARR